MVALGLEDTDIRVLQGCVLAAVQSSIFATGGGSVVLAYESTDDTSHWVGKPVDMRVDRLEE